MPDRPRDNQAGFALTELIVAMTVGLIILLAAFLLLDRAHGASNEIADRQDAVQRGRQAMELLTRQIRSQVCLGGFEEPITDGTNNSVTFYADLTDGSKNVERRTITFDPADGVNGTIKQFIYPGAGTYPVLTFPGYPGSPSETTTILTKADGGHVARHALPALLRLRPRRRARLAAPADHAAQHRRRAARGDGEGRLRGAAGAQDPAQQGRDHLLQRRLRPPREPDPSE